MKSLKSIVCLFAAVICTVSFADNFYWVRGSGNWSDKSNWFMDAEGTKPATRYPGEPTNVIDDVAYYATDHIAIFTGTAVGTITLDKDISIHRFTVEESSEPTEIVFESNAENPCKLTLTTKTTSSINDDTSIRGNRTAIFRNIRVKGVSFDFRGGDGIFDSGADIDISGSIYAWDNGGCLIRYLSGSKVKATLHSYNINGTHQIEGGNVSGAISPGSGRFTVRVLDGDCAFTSISFKSNSVFEVIGGNVKFDTMSLPATSKMIISGGEVYSRDMPVINEEASFIFTNGVFTVASASTVTDPRLLGSEDAVFKSTVSPSSSKYETDPSINVVKEDGDVVKCATVFATNGIYSAFHFANEATLIAKTLNLSRFTIAKAKNVTLFADRINLGTRLFPTLDGASLTVPNGTTFGAFGDWYVYDKNFSLNLGGDVVFDTTDCFDGISARTVTVSKVIAKPDLDISVRGNGHLTFVFKGSDYMPEILKSLRIGNGASFTYINNSKKLVVDEFHLGSNAELNLKSNMGTIEAINGTIDPTAKIFVQVNSDLSESAYSVISSPSEELAESIAEQITLVGEGANNFEVRTLANCVYLTNNEQPVFEEIGKSNIWCGANGGYWNDIKNWLGEKRVPNYGKYVNSGVSNHVYITGTRNTEITNNMEGTVYLARIAFLKDCGPARLTGGKFNLGSNGYRNVDTTPVSSSSKFPVIIDSEIYTMNSFGATVVSDSYMVFNGPLSIAKILRPCGDIRVGGNVSCAQVLLDYKKFTNGRIAKLHILNGGTVTASAQITNQTSASSCYVIDENGKLVFEDGKPSTGVRYTYGHLVTMKPSLINGLMDIQCPYFTIKNQYYHGTGEIRFASVQSDERGSSSVIVGGGLTVKPASWTTVTANAPDNYIKLAVTNNAILSAAANWTYGPASDVVPTTEAADRALELAEDSTLTIRSAGYQISFADPIIGPGNVVVEEGSKIALAGELLDSAKGGWTTFATVASFTCPETAHSSTLKFKLVDNEDGTVDVQARIAPALVISIR